MMIKATRDVMGKYNKASSIPENFYSDSSSSSDEEVEDEEQLQQDEVRRSMVRYGVDLRLKTMKVSFLIKILAFTAAIIVIPAELLLRNITMHAERDMIIGFQETFSHHFWQALAKVIIQLGEVMFVEGWAVFLYLFSDSLLGYKTSMVTFFGVFIIAIIKLIYQIPRPFWIFGDVEGKACTMDFSGPSDHAFLATFFYSYITLIYSKYTDKYINRIRISVLLVNAL